MKSIFLLLFFMCTLLSSAQLHNAPLLPDEKQESVEIEGYYGRGFEYSCFYVLKNDQLDNNPVWVYFDNDLIKADSLQFLTVRHPLQHGIYMKVNGIKRWGNKNGYGHMGYSNSQIIVTGILSIDTTKTRVNHVMRKTLDNALYIVANDTFYLPGILTPGRHHIYKAESNGYDYKLQLSAAENATVAYKLEIYKGNKKLMETNRILVMNLWRFLAPPGHEADLNTIAEYGTLHKVGSRTEFLKDKQNGRQVVKCVIEPIGPDGESEVILVEVDGS